MAIVYHEGSTPTTAGRCWASCYARGREPVSVRHSVVVATFPGRDEAEFRRVAGDRDVERAKDTCLICEAPTVYLGQIAALEAAGVRRVMLQ